VRSTPYIDQSPVPTWASYVKIWVGVPVLSAITTMLREVAAERIQRCIAYVMLVPLGVGVRRIGIDAERDQEFPNHAMALA
jgi:hypothetical protein